MLTMTRTLQHGEEEDVSEQEQPRYKVYAPNKRRAMQTTSQSTQRNNLEYDIYGTRRPQIIDLNEILGNKSTSIEVTDTKSASVQQTKQNTKSKGMFAYFCNCPAFRSKCWCAAPFDKTADNNANANNTIGNKSKLMA